MSKIMSEKVPRKRAMFVWSGGMEAERLVAKCTRSGCEAFQWCKTDPTGVCDDCLIDGNYLMPILTKPGPR